MKAVDRFLQHARMRIASRYLGTNLRLIDVGAHQGELFQYLGKKLTQGFGIEPLATSKSVVSNYTIEGGFFPATRPPEDGTWDAITMLAVLEHVPRDQQPSLVLACAELLRTGGRVIISVPSPLVDHILSVLKTLRLIDGMSLEEHYGFEPGDTAQIFSGPRFKLLAHRRFQLGLNNLYVFEKL